jgi:hypothetical protein
MPEGVCTSILLGHDDRCEGFVADPANRRYCRTVQDLGWITCMDTTCQVLPLVLLVYRPNHLACHDARTACRCSVGGTRGVPSWLPCNNVPSAEGAC